MIIRRIKNIKQDNQILQALREVDEEMDSSEYQESAKRTLNPEIPQSESIFNQTDNFLCEPSEPLYKQPNFKNPSHCLTIQQPLNYEPNKVEPLLVENSREETSRHEDVIKKFNSDRSHNGPSSSKIPRYSFNSKWQSFSSSSQNKEKSAKEDETRPIEKKFKKKIEDFSNSKLFKELHQTLNEKVRKDDEEENQSIKNKFNTSLMRSRLASTLSKFRSIRREEQVQVEPKPRYSYQKAVCKAENETTRSFLTEKGSAGIILDHLKGKTSSYSEKAKKRLVPQDVDSVDEQFSTIFGSPEVPKIQDKEQQIIPISYFEPKPKSRECITISYKTTLLQLKEFCLQENIDEQEVSIMIPEPLSVQMFEEGQKEEDIFRDAKMLLRQLSIPSLSVKIKRYTNCVIIVAGKIAIISHYSGQVYFGGWHLDQKTGLGLQWCTGKFIYYGQYKNSKRNGVGFYKTADGVIMAGLWNNSIFEGHLLDVSSVRKI